MGLLDRVLGKRNSTAEQMNSATTAKDKQSNQAIFLDADASSSLGDVSFMRRSNTIRRTFPGNVDNPSGGEMVQDVASMESQLNTLTPSLPGAGNPTETARTGGVPKKVKKTFAQQMSKDQLAAKLKGSAIKAPATNAAPKVVAASRTEAEIDSSSISEQPPRLSPAAVKPGDTSPFRSMVKEVTSGLI